MIGHAEKKKVLCIIDLLLWMPQSAAYQEKATQEFVNCFCLFSVVCTCSSWSTGAALGARWGGEMVFQRKFLWIGGGFPCEAAGGYMHGWDLATHSVGSDCYCSWVSTEDEGDAGKWVSHASWSLVEIKLITVKPPRFGGYLLENIL